MSSPIRRASVADTPVSGRTSSLFKRLLEEINDNGTPRSDPVFPLINKSTPKQSPQVTFSRRASLNCTIPPPSRQGSNAWAKGSSVAEDARQKLRALDEARQRKLSASQSTLQDTSTTAAQSNNTATSLMPIPASPKSQALHSPLFFSDFVFNRAATFADFDRPSPTAEEPDEFPRRKRDCSSICSPELCTKRPRHDIFVDMPSRNRVSFCPSPPTPRSVKETEVRTTHIASPTPTDPALAAHLSPLPEEDPPSPLNELRSTPKHAYTPFRPSTPCRSRTPSDAASPSATPAWARPLHLVDDEVSILKNVHGDRAAEHPLCLQCFRLHGEWRGMVGKRCEWCGGKERLEGHYWEKCFWAG